MPNCTINGTMWRTSRYRTMRADSHSPIPSAHANDRTMNKGSAVRRQSGTKRYQAIIPVIRASVIRKSTKLVTTALEGTIIRGKYIFEIRFALLTMLSLDKLIHPEINWNGS